MAFVFINLYIVYNYFNKPKKLWSVLLPKSTADHLGLGEVGAFLFLLLVTWLTGVECAPLENVPLTLSNTSGSKTTLIPSKYRIGVLASTFLPFDPVLPAAPYLKLIPIAQGTTGCWDEHSGSPKSCCWLWSVSLPKSTADHQSVMISFYSVCTEGAKM